MTLLWEEIRSMRDMLSDANVLSSVLGDFNEILASDDHSQGLEQVKEQRRELHEVRCHFREFDAE
ncbi:unnamed protein product [Brassica rapa subsp. narinosa]